MIAKIAEVDSMIKAQNNPLRLEVDGGMTSETIRPCLQAGANTFVAATAIFKHAGGISAGIKELRQALK
jgi:ribulose-phosphate 3-epimerase